MQHKFTPTKQLKRAALTLLALILACATAWAQDVEFTLGTPQPFYFTGNQLQPRVTWVTIINDNNETTEYGQGQFSVTYGRNINAGEGNCVINVKIEEGDYPHSGSTFINHYPITKRPMTVNIPNCEKHYGEADPTFTWQLVEDNLVQQDSLNNLRDYLLPRRLNGHLTRTAGEAMGDYAISYEGTNPIEFANYLVTVNPGTLTITAPNPDDFSVNADSTEYTIHTATGWNFFCDALQDNTTWNRFSGKTVKLGADIGTAQDPITRMAGKNSHDFTGTFDGDGHTLYVNITSDSLHDYTAPFSYIATIGNNNPIIRNLNVTGTVNATKNYASGIVGAFWGTLTIENCTSSVTINTGFKHAAGFIGRAQGNATITNSVSSVTINSSTNGDGTHGGFIGGSASGISTNITGCAFIGSLLGTSTNRCAGFMGYNSGTLNISNSLFAPASVTVSNDNSATFARNDATITNCYYTTDFNDGENFIGQGKLRHSITAGDYVTVENAGTATTYSTSGITSYGTGILYDNVLYAGNGDEVSLTLSNSIDVPDGYQYAYSTNAGTLEGSTLTMPDANVIVSAAFRSTGQPVSSIDYYIDNGYTSTEAIALDGTESRLGNSGQETWYFVGTDISHSGTILCSGNVNIILADGKTMTITSSGDVGIYVDGSLTIYGQDYITGTLNVNSDYTGICSTSGSGNITISGGTVNATGNATGGIYSSGNITISDSRVTAAGGNYGIGSSGSITIGCAYASDFIYASSYVVGSEGTLNIAEGKAFKDVDGNPYSGTIAKESDGAYPIDGKRLYPDCVAMKQVKGYDNGDGGWVFIASPVAGSIAPSEVHNLFPSAGETSNDYDLYRFNQSADLEWQNYHSHTDDFNLVIGQGYLYATKEDRTLVFSGEYPSGTHPVKVPLDYDEGKPLAGWNLVGNPFAVGAISNQPYYRMNAEGTALKTETETTAVAAMEGVFVQATAANQKVTFTAQTRGGEKSAVAALNISLSKLIEVKVPEPVEGPTQNNGVSTSSTTLALDNAIIRFDGGQTLEKFSFREGSTKIYIPQDGKDYAIATSNGQGEMPLNFKAEENGTYTISVNVDNVEMGYLHLIDNLTGADVDLLVPELVEGPASYTFTAKTTDYASRFRLVFSTLNENTDSNDAPFAFISNGNIIVNGEGMLQVVDVMGRVIVSQGGHTRCVPTSGMPAGVYMLRLIHGDTIRTQKIVVR